jgi:DNA replication protein DnaC
MTSTTIPANLNLESARAHLRRLGFYGLLAHAQALLNEPWLVRVIEIEDTERARRSLKRRLDHSRLGAFKPIADFDWDWPEQCDRRAIEELFSLGFHDEAANVVFIGNTGVVT